MFKSAIVAIAIFSTSLLLSAFHVGYAEGGKAYISKHREKRRSIRPGSRFYGGYYGSGSFRGGK